MHVPQTAILGMMYVIGIAFGLIASGLTINNYLTLVYLDKWYKLWFAGGLLSCTFWVSQVITIEQSVYLST